MRKNSIVALALILVVMLAALVYGSARVTEHMQPERGQPTTNADRGSDAGRGSTGNLPAGTPR